MKYILDTNLSFITELELLSYPYLENNEEKEIKNLLKNFQIIDIDEIIKEKTINLRKKYKLKLPDCIILATAQAENACFITEDKKLYKVKEVKIKGLEEVILNE